MKQKINYIPKEKDEVNKNSSIINILKNKIQEQNKKEEEKFKIAKKDKIC